jgi:hypothetical protein
MKNLRQQVDEGHLVCSWHKITDALQLPQQEGILKRQNSSINNGSDFCSVTYKDALTLCDLGWDAGAREAEKHPEYVDVFTQSVVPSTRWGFSDTEGEMCWDKLLSGDDRFLQLPQIHSGFARACRVVVSCVASSAIDDAAFLQRAIDIAAGMFQLEQQRIATELWAVVPYQGNPCSYAFKVHTTGDPFNLSKVAFFCGHSAVLRRITFGLNERANESVQRDLGICYGYPGGLSKENLEHMQLPPWDGDTLLINTLRSNDIAVTRRTIVKGFHKTLTNLQDSEHDSNGIIQV